MARKKMTKQERKILDRLQTELDDRLAMGWATMAHTEHFDAHRGAWKMPSKRNECVIFGNDGFSKDVRVRIEVARLVRKLERLRIKVLGFGLSKEGGYSWALRVVFKDADLLDRLVWDVWFSDICGMKDNPVSEELKEMFWHLKSVRAA
jgi:hypothetical protein